MKKKLITFFLLSFIFFIVKKSSFALIGCVPDPNRTLQCTEVVTRLNASPPNPSNCGNHPLAPCCYWRSQNGGESCLDRWEECEVEGHSYNVIGCGSGGETPPTATPTNTPTPTSTPTPTPTPTNTPTPQPATISSLSCYVTPSPPPNVTPIPQTCNCTNDDTPEWKWQVSGSYITDYNLYRSWETQNPRSCVGSPNVCSFSNRHFFPSGLVGKTGTFTFEVSAINTQEGPKNSSTVKIDKLPPFDPAFISVSCLNGKVSASWNTGIDQGCANLHQFPYRAQYSLSEDFSTVQNDMNGDNNWKDLWGQNTSRTSAKVFPTGTTVYVRIKYRDAFDQQTDWISQSAVCLPNNCENPTLTPFPPQKPNTQVNFSFTAPVGASSCTLNVDGQQQAQVTPNPSNRSCQLSWTPTSSKNYWFRTFTTTNNQPTDCQTGNFCIDALPPSIPQNRQLSCFYDGSLRGYRITYSWDPLSQDNGCAGLDTYPYLAQYSLSSTFSNYQNDMSGDDQWKDLWGQNSQRTTGKAFNAGQNVCFRVKSRDSLENESGWSSVSCITVDNQRCDGGPTPTITSIPTPTSTSTLPPSPTLTPTPTSFVQSPINLKAQCSVDASSFTLSWQSPAGADHQNFWLQVGTSSERHPDNPSDSFSDGSLVSANKFNDWVGKVYSKTITGIASNTDYYVIVKASNSSGQQSRWTPEHNLPPLKVNCVYSNTSSVYGYTYVDEGSNDPQTRGIPGCAANDRSVCIYDGKFQERAICGARIILASNSAGTNPPANFDVNNSSYNSFSIFCYSAYNQKWSRWNEDDPVKNYQCQLNSDKTLMIRTCTEAGNPNCNWVNCGSVADFFQGNIFIGGVKNLQACKSASYLQEVQIRPKYVFYSCPKAARAGGITDYHLPPEENNEYKVWLVSHTSGNFPGFFNTYYDTGGSSKNLYLVPDQQYILTKLGSYSPVSKGRNFFFGLLDFFLNLIKRVVFAQSSNYQYDQFYPQNSPQTYSPSTNSGPVYFGLGLVSLPTPTPTDENTYLHGRVWIDYNQDYNRTQNEPLVYGNQSPSLSFSYQCDDINKTISSDAEGNCEIESGTAGPYRSDNIPKNKATNCSLTVKINDNNWYFTAEKGKRISGDTRCPNPPYPCQCLFSTPNDNGSLIDGVCLSKDSNNRCIELKITNINASYGPVNIWFGVAKNYDNWIKLKNSAFSSTKELINEIPYTITAFDGEDTNDKNFLNGPEPGVLTSASLSLGNGNVSTREWKKTPYVSVIKNKPLEFLNYSKNRKKIIKITDINQISQPGLYWWEGDLNLNNSILSTSSTNSFVLLIDGNLNIDEQNFNFATDCVNINMSKNIVLLTTGKIQLSSNTQCLAGVFITNDFNTGENNNLGLKVKGNLVVYNNNINNRKTNDNLKPSVFIVFEPRFYLENLSSLSVSYYDWRELAP